MCYHSNPLSILLHVINVQSFGCYATVNKPAGTCSCFGPYSLHFQMTTSVDGSCRDDFIGTSAACPLVSGTIALTLQAKWVSHYNLATITAFTVPGVQKAGEEPGNNWKESERQSPCFSGSANLHPVRYMYNNTS